ncbi:uncharacterized protein VDAG_01605 [Verticillium dahliae VdLs.17]|uniref:Uncharacterized protein n=1 Tax=Verticillium dahliae (strain VdLs.17 / ATCC MYA-4575 / FGSC 10137) TaxID=498257 RepID=G2WSK9_VERDV|nr:uncharacterized protein VDAG_01605 [Verticillium dahliae VdLs.17]EGY17923.1 hypothetical protein VDAG_01605 [Verticillium dahliae VdLs.17]
MRRPEPGWEWILLWGSPSVHFLLISSRPLSASVCRIVTGVQAIPPKVKMCGSMCLFGEEKTWRIGSSPGYPFCRPGACGREKGEDGVKNEEREYSDKPMTIGSAVIGACVLVLSRQGFRGFCEGSVPKSHFEPG